MAPEPQPDLASEPSTHEVQPQIVPEDKESTSAQSQSKMEGTDIGELLSKGKEKLQSTDLMRALKGRRAPPKDRLPFSMHKKGGKMEKRYLGRHYYDTFPWLTSSEMDGYEGAWCLWCALFKTSSTCGGHWDLGTQTVGTLVEKPLKSYAKLTGKDGALTTHANTNDHKSVASKVTEFLARAPVNSKDDIASLIDTKREELRQENRTALRAITDTVLTCARQNIALRGHRDSGRLSLDEPNENDGNLRALLRMRIRAGDRQLERHVTRGLGNAQYISPEIQNQLLECASDLLKEKVLCKAKMAGVWSVIADETTDRKKREQLTIALRYVEFIKEENGEKQKPTIAEAPICVVDVLQEMKEIVGIDPSDGHSELAMSGRNIGTVILAKLKELNLDLAKLVGQGYDGASSMASQQVGVAAVVKAEAPHAEYFHCVMHMLNLCATKSTQVVSIRNCLDVIQQMTSFFNSSAKRVTHLEAEIAQADLEESKQRRLKTLCQTRFLERHEAVINTLSLLPYVIRVVENMTGWQMPEARRNAASLLRAITSFDFLVSLHILAKVSGILLPAWRGIQSVGLDLVEAVTLVKDATEVLMSWRNDDTFDRLFANAEKMASDLNVTVERPRTASRSVYRPNATSGVQVQNSTHEYYKLNVFLPLIDSIATHLQDRFSPTHQKIMHLMHLVPAFISTYEDVLPAAEMYASMIDVTCLEGEFAIWLNRWKNTELKEKRDVNTAILALEQCSKITLPNIHMLLQVLATLPVTTAQAERTFSKLERTATAIRASMGEERLEAMLLIQTYRKETPSTDEVLDKFCSSQKGNRSRRILL